MEVQTAVLEEQTAAKRLFVGGLGEKVTEEDIRKTFCHLGTLQSVDIIRTKGRSFAYINFLPSSQNSLAKLFSTYNGCSWKGGKLKLEKAKEHYIDRLKREWAEDAELKSSNHDEVDGGIVDSPEPLSTLDLKDMEFRLFFPKLRKVRPLPLSGTGKHKYSFRRLEAPPVPVHFCECPDHSVPDQPCTVTHAKDSRTQKGGINKEVHNMKNSVINRFPRRGTFLDSREAAVHDSEIQDCGINEEEINMMDSVMKKLLERGTSSRKDRGNLQASQKKTVLTSVVREETNDIEDGTDGDGIKINAVSSRSGERQTSLPNEETLPDEETMPEEETFDIDDETDDDDIKINVVAVRSKRQTGLASELMQMTRSSELRNQDDLARQSKAGILNQKVESSNRKRKSFSIEADANELASPVKKSEEHAVVKNVTESETKKSSISGRLSQKSRWKQLVGDGSSSSFTLSQITPGDDTNLEEQPKLGNTLSSDIKKGKRVKRVVPKTPSGSKEHEEENTCVQRDSQSSGRNKKSKKVRKVVSEEPKPSDETPTGQDEHEEANMSVQMDDQSSQHDEDMEPPVAQPTEATTVSEKVTQGSSWLQKSTWTQLVGGDNNSSFSISQVLSGDQLQKQNSYKPDNSSTVNTIATGAFFKKPRGSETTSDIPRGMSSLDGSIGKKEAQVASSPTDIGVSKASGGTDLSVSATKRTPESEPKHTPSYSRVQISESCPFMRNADSVKEWMTAKTAVSNSLKRLKNK